MFKNFFPNDYISSIFEIDIESLKKQGIKGLIFDIDNTLVPYDVEAPTKEIIKFFKELRENGFKICLLSNNTKERVIRFNQGLKIFAIHKARKPLVRNFKRAMQLLETDKHSTAIVGDQIFTDVYGGNRAGLTTILVAPVSDKDEWITKIKRGVERRVINAYQKSRKNQ